MKLFLKILFKNFYDLLKTKNDREFLRLVFKYGDKPRYQKEMINFFSYKMIVPDCLSFVWQFKEIFADEVYKFPNVSEIPIIYDCGANIGMSCLYFRKIYPNSKLIAFEADPNIAEILIQNLKQNNIGNVKVIPKAVWINEDGVELSIEGADASSIYSSKNKVKIESVRLKNFLQSEKYISLLKLDIEGAEVEVLKDCHENLLHVKNIFIEYHSYMNGEQSLDSILNILTENGFRYFIKPEADRKNPFINKINKNNPSMDLQINIFGYRDR